MSTKSTLSGRTALVTGGAKRLGLAVCRALAGHGVNVAIHHRGSAKEAAQAAEEFRAMGVFSWTVGENFADPGAAGRVFEEALQKTGAVDFLINSASIFPADTLPKITAKSVGVNMQINALAPLELSLAFAAQGRPGAIVNFLDARMLDYDREHVSYHLSKRALFTLTGMLAVDLAPSIRVNAVAPGLVLPPEGKDESYLQKLANTNPLNRYGLPEDIARAVIYLLESDFVTGQVLYVDGGRHLRSGIYQP